VTGADDRPVGGRRTDDTTALAGIDDVSGSTPAGWMSPGVVGVAAASFFSDSGHEIATSLLPSFLTSVLHAGPGALGAVEGVSDALIGVSKLAGGPLATEPSRRGRLASGGYLGTAVATAAIGLATAIWQVAILRALAWVSRGIRSPARDTLLVSLVPRNAFGRASGLERAGDNAGALVGPLLASLLVGVIGVRATIGLAIVPGVLAAASITVAARQARRSITAPAGRARLSLNLGEMRRAGIVRALAPAAAFELGNLATTLLILRATGLLQATGRSATAATSVAILLYAGHNAVAALASVVGGSLTDRLGPRLVFAGGAAAYLMAYALFAVGPHAWSWLLIGFALAGLGIGLAETAQSATVALLLPDRLRDRLRGPGIGAGVRRPRRVPGRRRALGGRLPPRRLQLRGRMDDTVAPGQPPGPEPVRGRVARAFGQEGRKTLIAHPGAHPGVRVDDLMRLSQGRNTAGRP
jgi:MFS family permease